MTDAKMWFVIAKRIRDEHRTGGHGPGPYLCNEANALLRKGLITEKQHALVAKAVDRERKRQYGYVDDSVLWGDFCGDAEYALRIRFCAKQIQKLTRVVR